jgi:hypothetical protein
MTNLKLENLQSAVLKLETGKALDSSDAIDAKNRRDPASSELNENRRVARSQAAH